jgi:hypothetical protein
MPDCGAGPVFCAKRYPHITESGDRDKRFIGPALQKFVKVGAAAAFSTFRWHDVPATLQADDPGLSQRVFCEPCREIIILSTVVSKFKPPQS